MDLQELKNTIAVIESADKNKENWSKLKNRELCIIPVDSEYYSDFKEWTKTQRSGMYDGDKEKSPMYIKGKDVDTVLNHMIDSNNKFSEPHRQKLSSVLNK